MPITVDGNFSKNAINMAHEQTDSDLAYMRRGGERAIGMAKEIADMIVDKLNAFHPATARRVAEGLWSAAPGTADAP